MIEILGSSSVSNELIAVESARTIDRLRMQGALSVDEVAERIAVVNDWLDAIHLATALIWRERSGRYRSSPRMTGRLAPPRVPSAEVRGT